jgi:hypothetical protein
MAWPQAPETAGLLRHRVKDVRSIPLLFKMCDIRALYWVLPQFQVIDFTANYWQACYALLPVWKRRLKPSFRRRLER